MKKFCLIFFCCGYLFSQAHYTILSHTQYEECKVVPRIDNSGIYAISSFDVDGSMIYLRHFDEPLVTVVQGKNISLQQADAAASLDITKGFVGRSFGKNQLPPQSALQDKNIHYVKSFLGSNLSLFASDGGELTNSSGETIHVHVESRNNVSLQFELSEMKKVFHLSFPGDLAYADLIGIDAKGNSFVLIERYQSEIPLKVQREIYTLSPDGDIRSCLAVPMIKFCVLVKEFQIDSSGALYHLLAARDGLHLIRWDGLTTYAAGTISYPKEFQYEEHYNTFLTTAEAVPETPKGILTAANRQTALRLGEEYALHTYTCAANNLSPFDVIGPDGDAVRTPSWLVPGINARVAYMWGGFNTLTQYDAGLASGKYAGDINTAGVSAYAVGVDCSGFVSRCWQLTSHYATSMMPDITTQYAAWDELKPGDAIHKVGHVRMFVEKMPNGSLRVVESSGRGWDVSYWSYAPSDLNGVYTPRYYNGMETTYSMNKPELVSASIVTDSTVQLVWKSDTTQVAGYRLYATSDGKQWSQLMSESILKDTSVVLVLKNSFSSYRVSSVLRGSQIIEGPLSNALSVGNFLHTSKILIVDGFERASGAGSWQGPGNVFVTRYGVAIGKNKTSYESIKNSQLTNLQFQLSNYATVFWMLGDESTQDETFSTTEQTLVKQYLESGGHLFVSGSEVGWDLSYKGSASDKEFYGSYLKAAYVSDDAGSYNVNGIGAPIFTKCSFTIGQMYDEDYPDEISSAGGSSLCFQYGNQKGAGVSYRGNFGSSVIPGGVMYLSFPLETTASDSGFENVINCAMEYFDPLSFVEQPFVTVLKDFSLSQNYPNPFNPSTMINYHLPMNSFVSLKVFDLVGREVATLVNENLPVGAHEAKFNASSLSSGMYFYTLQAGNYRAAKKMVLVK